MYNYLNVNERTAPKRLAAALDQRLPIRHNHPLVESMYRDADQLCAICKARRGKRNHALDHCHKTGKLRGVLCGNCNTGLGMFVDSPSLLRAASDYLELSR